MTSEVRSCFAVLGAVQGVLGAPLGAVIVLGAKL